MKYLSFNALVLFCVLALSLPTAAQQPQIKTPPISVQLWSVKEALKADFHGTLKAIADMGFAGVEFAGDFGPYNNDPSALKQKLASLGLQASSAHVGFDALTENTLAHTLLFYKTLGVNTLYIPWDERAWDAKRVALFTQQLNAAHAQAQRFDMEIGFHNHEREFEPYQGATFWDYIATHSPNSLPLQLDIGWVQYAQQDAQALIKAYPQRTRSAHIKVVVKGNSLSPILGNNGIRWDEILTTLMNEGKTQWLILEQEQYPQQMTPLQSVAASKLGLDKVLARLQN
ncbi:sugar phosphate isomerase/epimerase family protein [Pseudoalteromonas sp. T1lg48]|uniref:sugar phosphate isomerase/epimerase family protein n=1 Tax=Pseudoalteromonas sp. T1lg48 TaxID=2077100 RepID=UPI000CF6CD4E|nr:sugar phosphate isomerase/epimerase [Pseudoalteromonas sp. T1lg48]